MGPLGAHPIFSKPNLEATYLDTWLCLLESYVWKFGTRNHTCSKCVAISQVAMVVHFLLLVWNENKPKLLA
jgi:hypothetical protein